MDYYKLLGVNEDSDATTIKKAYRELAIRYHPDKNPDDKVAEEHFKKISEAYQVLSNPDKRAQYDVQRKFGSGGGGMNFEDLFAQFFGGQNRVRHPEVSIVVTLEELLVKKEKELNLKAPEGALKLKVNLAGVTDGSRFQQSVQDKGIDQLIINFDIRPEQNFATREYDLFTLIHLPYETLLLGGEIPIKLPDGEVLAKFPELFSVEKLLRVRGRGLYRQDGSRGDLMVQVKLQMPEKVSAKDRKHFSKK